MKQKTGELLQIRYENEPWRKKKRCQGGDNGRFVW